MGLPDRARSGGAFDLIAYCAAATVKPERGPHIDRVAAAAGLDLVQWWTPTARGYFSRVSKAKIAEAVTEAVTGSSWNLPKSYAKRLRGTLGAGSVEA